MLSTQTSQSSHPLSDSDVLALQMIMTQVAVSLLSWGISTTFSLVALYITIKAYLQHSSTAHIKLFSITLLMLLTSGALMVLNTEYVIAQLLTGGYNPPDVIPLLKNLVISVNFVERMNYVISDGVVVWRAWVMFSSNLYVRILLVGCMVGSCVGAMTDAGLAAKTILKDLNGPIPTTTVLLLTLPLLTTNIVATALIGYKTWHHHQDIKKNLQTTSGSLTKVQKVLLLLIESSLVYCLLWVIYVAIVFHSQDQQSLTFQVYSSILPNLSALYPVLIILIVAMENSKESSLNGGSMSLSQSIRFASAAAGPVQDTESTAVSRE
ncbi:hypothetical protein VKT23_007880 [Stygiomarasmius scandens]|uniref:Taste receptor type 2 n=1 Tax=Marasmiellus scandens TaxID=2682957 RepID=A0ABR1JKV0_9AGAR